MSREQMHTINIVHLYMVQQGVPKTQKFLDFIFKLIYCAPMCAKSLCKKRIKSEFGLNTKGGPRAQLVNLKKIIGKKLRFLGHPNGTITTRNLEFPKCGYVQKTRIMDITALLAYLCRYCIQFQDLRGGNSTLLVVNGVCKGLTLFRSILYDKKTPSLRISRPRMPQC